MNSMSIFVAIIFLAGNIANASEISTFSVGNFKTNRGFDNNKPIQFTERGIEFFVFSNGEFDFNTNPGNNNGNVHYRTAENNELENKNCRNTNFGIIIENDNYGRVRRVGNTFINYDYSNRVSRIGTIFIKYNRFSLDQVGGLKLIYNRFGEIIDTFGSVKSTRNYDFDNVKNNHSYEDNRDNGYNNSGTYYRKNTKKYYENLER